MLKSVTVINHVEQSIKMELTNPTLSGLNITNITGLGPGTADIMTTPMANLDGAAFNTSRRGARNIVLTLSFMSTPSVEYNRLQTYVYFPLKRKIKLIFETDNRMSEIEGYVESNDPVIFSKNTSTQISIICPDPFFKKSGSDSDDKTTFSGVDPMFSFPFSNEDLVDPTMPMGEIQTKAEHKVMNTGETEVGIVVKINAIGFAENVRLYNLTTDQHLFIDTTILKTITGNVIIAGDDITISTVKGDKYATLIRGGKSINILNAIDRGKRWLQLNVGDNIFSFTTTSNATSNPANIQLTVSSKVLYDGI